MKWYHFEFWSGANPYIATTERNAKKNIRYWTKKGYIVEQIVDNFYIVYDK